MIRFIVLLFLLFELSAFSQDLSYVHYSTHNGLPSNQVYNIFQDSNGFVWFATDRGIAKYDGNKFTQYDQSDGLPSSTIFRFFPQRNGEVWCSTFQNRLFYFNPDHDKFYSYKYNDSVVKYSKGSLNENFYLADNGTVNISYQNYPGVLVISNDGQLLNSLPTTNHEVSDLFSVIEHNDSSFFNFFLYDTTDFSNYNVLESNNNYEFFKFKHLGIEYHKEFKLGNAFMFSMDNHLVINNKAKERTITKNFDNKILGIGKYDDNHIWVGFFKGGVKVISLDGQQKHHFLKNKSVTYCKEDTHGGVWFSTLSKGVYHSRNNNIQKYPIDNDFSYVTNGKDDKVIAGTIAGDNYEIYNNDIELLSSLKKKKPDFIFYSNNSGFYFSSTSGASNYSFQSENLTTNLNTLPSTFYVTFCEDFQKPFLAAGTVRIEYFNKATNSFSNVCLNNRIRSVCWHEKGIYIGTLNGLMNYDTIAENISPFPNPLLEVRVEKVMTYNAVTYVGTMGEGLLLIDGDSIIQVGKVDGLSSNLVNDLYVQNDSVSWVATNNGLNRVLVTQDCTLVNVYNEDDGLIDSYINDVFVKGNKVWIATRSGLCSMDIPEVVTAPTYDLYFNWNAVKIGEVSYSDSSLSLLSYNENNLIFSYNAAYFSAKQGINFRYKLAGKDNAWNYTSSREIKYFLLSPGIYSIKVQASVNGKNWGDNELTKTFIIYPPFYQTWWFYLLVCLAVGALIYFFFRIRVLSYNKDIVRELLRLLLKRLTPNARFFTVKEQGVDVKISSDNVLFVKSDGNYLEIYTTTKRHVIRCKIGDFISLVPDKIEYLRVSRSCIVRIDKITAKGQKSIQINEHEIAVGRTYQKLINELPF